MASRATYSDADKARAYVALQANEGNVKRTARDLRIPVSTLRLWRNEWRDIGPPNLDDPIVQAEITDFIENAERIRNKALMEIENKIPSGSLAQLSTVVGVLDDKITRAKGLATGRVEHVHSLPSPDDIRDALVAGIQGAVEAARQRHEEIVEADFEEQSLTELPAAR